MTIAQQLKIKDFPFIIKDKDGRVIYYEVSDRGWVKSEWDDGKVIRCENSTGYWSKSEYDVNSKKIYYEDSYGYIEDNRPKTVELTLEEIADKLGMKVEQLRIKV